MHTVTLLSDGVLQIKTLAFHLIVFNISGYKAVVKVSTNPYCRLALISC
jgi:hypothetical protein